MIHSYRNELIGLKFHGYPPVICASIYCCWPRHKRAMPGFLFQAIRNLRACRISQSADGSIMCLGEVALWAAKR